jgi:hypothetical protein
VAIGDSGSPIAHFQALGIGLAGDWPLDHLEEQTMSQSLIGVFNNLEDAVEAREQLRKEGFADSAIRLHRDPAVLSSDGPHSAQDAGSWLRSLFSLDEDYVGMYSEAVRRGHHLLTVDAASESELDTARRVMERTRCIDIERTCDEWRAQGWQPESAATPQPAGEQARDRGRIRVVNRV